MITASVKKVEVVIKKIEHHTVYNLELSFEQLELLGCLMNRIGGSPEKSKRKIADEIAKKIREYCQNTGLEMQSSFDSKELFGQSDIYFNETEGE